MLTTEERRWLNGEKIYEGEHAKQQRYQRRRDTRERIYNSLLDFSTLFEHLEDDERQTLFGSPETRQKQLTDDSRLGAGIRDGLAFLLYNTGITEAMGSTDDARPLAEWFLAEAIHRVGRKDGFLVEDVDISIDAMDVPHASLLEHLEADENLTPWELCMLVESAELDMDDLQDAERERMDRDTEETVDTLTGGTHPADDIHPEVIESMQEIGIDISDREPQKISTEELDECDMVATMGCSTLELDADVEVRAWVLY